MIAKITIRKFLDRRNIDAVLGDDGKWACAVPVLQEALNYRFNPTLPEYEGPANGAFGVRCAHEAAQLHGATIKVEEKPSPPEGTIY